MDKELLEMVRKAQAGEGDFRVAHMAIREHAKAIKAAHPLKVEINLAVQEFLYSPSAENFARLEIAMLCYQSEFA